VVENGKRARPDDAPSFDLNELVAQITDENRHEEINTGSSVERIQLIAPAI
jgi:antitoxin component of MazEF toxin-antitoxin module